MVDMKCLILEDELPAAARLCQLLIDHQPRVHILATLHSLGEGISWLQKNGCPDFIFMDINLSDGLSFELFDYVNVTCPVIFTTAHDEYWMHAFEHNGIDYLLKPIVPDKLMAALAKLDRLRQHFNATQWMSWQKPELLQSGQFKKRFLVKKGSELLSIPTEQIAYFYASQKVVCLVNKDGQRFVVDPSLSEIEKKLDPDHFFRLNRQILVARNAIGKVKSYAKSKLLVDLLPAFQEEVVVSQETLAEFKAWMDN
jgi:two-component system LytT family response regulator